MTLVCPAEGAHIKGLTSIPWFDGNGFGDPIKLLNSVDRQLLRSWVEELSKKLVSWREPPAWRYGHDRLIFELDQFASALALANTDSQEHPMVIAPQARLELGDSVYSIVGSAIRADPASVDSSDVLLQTEEPGANPVLVLFRQGDPDTHLVPDIKHFSSISVMDGLSVLDIEHMNWGTNPTKLGKELLPNGVEWVDPKELFLDRLTFINGTQQSASLSHVPGQSELALERKLYPLLPIATNAAGVLRGLDLTKVVAFDRSDKGIKVTLSLPLKGDRVLSVHRTYSPDLQAVIPEEDSPVLEIWPPFKRKDWNFYASFWWSNSDSAVSATPFPDDGQVSEEASGRNGKVQVRQMSRCPAGFFLARKAKNSAGYGSEEPAGAVLVRIPELRAPNRGTYVAGVDFGTSSTNVILRNKSGNDSHEKLELKTGPLQVLAGDVVERLVASSRYFLPIGPEKAGDPREVAPFLSFLRERRTASRNSEPILGAHILFLNSHNTADLGTGEIETQLKWDNSKRKVALYLHQLCLQTAAEVIARGGTGLEWRYSLPTAFNRRRRDQYSKQVWAPLVDYVRQHTGLGGHDAKQLTESTAAARYFKEIAKAPVSSGVVFVDIGGGTSDISVWQNNLSKYQVSIQFAGRDLFLGPLFEAPSIKERLFEACRQALPDVFSQERVKDVLGTNNSLIFDAHFEALLRDAGRRFPEERVHKGLTLTEELSKADGNPLEVPAQIIRLGIAGLFFYLGLIIRSLEEKGVFERNLGGVYLGGNGSQLLHWADDGCFNPDGEFAAVLVDCLIAGAGWNGNLPRAISVRLSEHPKEEASAGLVVEANLSSDETERWDEVVSGEPFKRAGSSMSETTILSREDMRNIKVEGLPQIEKFYAIYLKSSNAHNFKLSSDFLPDRLIKMDIFRQVHQFVADQQGKKSDDVELAPLFIRGLRELLRELPNRARLS
jgi:hypothetical protein